MSGAIQRASAISALVFSHRHEVENLGLALGEPRLSLLLEEQRAFYELDDDGLLASFDRQRRGDSGQSLLAEPFCDFVR